VDKSILKCGLILMFFITESDSYIPTVQTRLHPRLKYHSRLQPEKSIIINFIVQKITAEMQARACRNRVA
jgi:hypothetical protein